MLHYHFIIIMKLSLLGPFSFPLDFVSDYFEELLFFSSVREKLINCDYSSVIRDFDLENRVRLSRESRYAGR